MGVNPVDGNQSAMEFAATRSKLARERGCAIQVGTDMPFHRIPLHLEVFGFGKTTPDELRAVAALD